MTRLRALFFFLLLAAVFAPGIQSQASSPPTDKAISELASRMGQRLKNLHISKVVVSDLTGPQGQALPLGKWLADQLSLKLAAGFPTLETLDRPHPQPFSSDEAGRTMPAATNPEMAQASARVWASQMGASVVVTGMFADLGGHIGVSLKAFNSSAAALLLAEEWGEVPDNALPAWSVNSLPSIISPGLPMAGRNGFTTPECLHCPAPNYSDEARRQKLAGVVVLQVTVSAEGKTTDIYVWKSVEAGLDKKTVHAVSTWKWKPAVGPDGKPATVTVPVELSFRLY